MAVDWNKPGVTDNHSTGVLQQLVENIKAVLKMTGEGTNVPSGAIRWNGTTKRFETWNGSSWVELIVKASDKYDINVDRVDGLDAGNASGNVAVNNGTVNTNLNADMVDGYHAGTGANQVLVLDGSGLVPSANLPPSGVTPGTFQAVVVDAKGRVTGGTNPTTLAGYGIADAAGINGDVAQVFSVAAATARTHAARLAQVQDDATSAAAASGTDTYTATLSPAITAYASNHVYWVQFANPNTVTTPTLNLNAIGAKTIKRQDGTALRAGDLNGWHALLYNGTDLLLLNPAPRAAFGKVAVWVPAEAMSPRATSGCASLATVAGAADRPDLRSLDFDPTTQEFAEFAVRMPKSWNEGTITFAAAWSHAATTVNFGVVWQIQGVARSDGEDIGGVAYGTAVTVADTGGTTDRLYLTAESGSVTIAGSPAAEDVVYFRVARAPANGSDTMAVDARLHGITLYLTTDTETDA